MSMGGTSSIRNTDQVSNLMSQVIQQNRENTQSNILRNLMRPADLTESLDFDDDEEVVSMSERRYNQPSARQGVL